jgi:hypothetical protein
MDIRAYERNKFMNAAFVGSIVIHIAILFLQIEENFELKQRPEVPKVEIQPMTEKLLQKIAMIKKKAAAPPQEAAVTQVAQAAGGTGGDPGTSSAVEKVKSTAKNVQTGTKNNFKLDLSSSVSGLFASNKGAGNSNNSPAVTRNIGSTDINVGNVGESVGALKNALSKGVGGTGNGNGGGFGNGKGLSGSGLAGGLGTKDGIDTSFMETKTVIMGSMDAETLRRILREYIPQFRHCYQQELQKSTKKLEGVIDLGFRIEGNGKVSKIDVKSKGMVFSGQGHECMSQVLSRIEFPKPKGGGLVDVVQPLNFLSEQQKF